MGGKGGEISGKRIPSSNAHKGCVAETFAVRKPRSFPRKGHNFRERKKISGDISDLLQRPCQKSIQGGETQKACIHGERYCGRRTTGMILF